MPAKIRQKQYFAAEPVVIPGASLAGTVNALATLTTGRTRAKGVNVTTLTLAAQTVTVAAASDFGSLLLFTLPASRCLFVAADVVLTSTQAGFAVNNGTSMVFALGSAAASNTTLDTTMVDFVASTSGTGTTAGTIAATSTSTEQGKIKAASTAIYFNLSSAVTSGTGTLTLTGTIKILWQDIGSA